MDGKVLYVRDFLPHYSRSQAKRSDAYYWVSQSTKLSNRRYFSLIRHDDSGQFYGVFRIMIAVAASGHIAGLCTDAQGVPYTLADLSKLTGLAQRALRKVLPWLIENGYLWLADTVDEAAAAVEAERPPSSTRSAAPSGAPSEKRSRAHTHTTPKKEEEEKRPAPSSPDPRGAGPLDGPRAVQRLLAAEGVSETLGVRLSALSRVSPAAVASIAGRRPANLRSADGWWITQLKAAGLIAGDWK